MAWTNPYDTTTAFTQTNLDGVASSATLVAGWTSASVTTAADDYIISANFQVESAGLSAGAINVYVYTGLNGTSSWPDLFSAGTEGTEGTATIQDTEVRDSAFVLIWSTATDTTASRNYPMPQIGIAQFFGGVLPQMWAIFVTQSTGAALETTGDPNVVYRTPVIHAGP